MKPIILNQNANKSEYLHIRLYEAIREMILNGEIKEGEKLPSLRMLAKDLDVSVTTTSQAYNQLLVEGYIQSRPQSGYFAAKVSGSERAETAQYEATESGIEKNRAEGFVHDPSCFDFIKWKKCAAKVFNECTDELLYESDPQGELELREEISKYIFRSRGVSASADRIVIGAGTQQITSHLSRILRKMGIGHVALEEPGYLPVQYMFRDAGFGLSHIRVGEDGIDISRLPVNIESAVYVSPSNQFPTGAVMPAGRRYELLKWADENGSIIIEDDYDSELRYFGKPVPALKSLDRNDRVVYLGSFSSTLFPAIKISYMVLPKNMAEIFDGIKRDYTQTCSKAEQLTLAFYMKEGYYYTGIRKLRTLYAKKLEKILDAFSRYAGDSVTAVDTRSGITITLKIKSEIPVRELSDRAGKLGIEAVPVSDITDQKTSAISLYYSQIPLDRIDELVAKLVECWK